MKQLITKADRAAMARALRGIRNEGNVVDCMRSLSDKIDHELDLIVNGMGQSGDAARMIVTEAVRRLLGGKVK